MPVTLSASCGSGSTAGEILRCAQNDSQGPLTGSLISKRLRIMGALQIIKGMVHRLVTAHGSKAVQIACIMPCNFFTAEVKN